MKKENLERVEESAAPPKPRRKVEESRAEFKKRVAEMKDFMNRPDNVGRSGMQSAYLNDPLDMDGRRTERSPNLSEIDGEGN